MSERYPCRGFSLPTQQAAEEERYLHELQTKEPWECFVCVEGHWHIREKR